MKAYTFHQGGKSQLICTFGLIWTPDLYFGLKSKFLDRSSGRDGFFGLWIWTWAQVQFGLLDFSGFGLDLDLIWT